MASTLMQHQSFENYELLHCELCLQNLLNYSVFDILFALPDI